MKKIISLTLTVIALATGTAYSQSFKFGIKIGTDIKKLSGKSFDDQFSYGYHVGGFAELGLGSKIGLQPEVYFSQVNIDTSGNFSDIHNFSQITKVQLKYLNIPIMVSYKPNRFVSLQAGPQFGILMNNSKNLVQNGKDAFKSGDFSMLAGLQLNISKVRLYGRYGIGLRDLNDIDNKDKWRSETIQLGLGFTF